MPPMAYCVAISVLKPWRADLKAFLARVAGMTDKTAHVLFYKPASNVDIHGEQGV